MGYAIKPMSVGEILDQGIKVFRDHFVLIAGAFCALYIPPQIILQFLTDSLVQTQQLTQEQMRSMSPEETTAMAMKVVQGTFTAMLIAMPLLFMAYTVGEGAVIYAASKKYLEEDATIGGSIKYGFNRMVPLIWTGIIKTIIIMIGFVFLILPGVYFLFRYALSSQVVVLEKVSGMEALNRSSELMSQGKHIYQLLGIGIIFWIVSILVGMVAGLLGQNMIATLVLNVITSVLTAAFACIVVVFYFSARCRVEGFDLALLAQSLDGEDEQN